MFKDAPDAGSGGHGDSVQKEIVTPPEHERLNQKIQSGSQTLGTSVPPRESGDTDNAPRLVRLVRLVCLVRLLR